MAYVIKPRPATRRRPATIVRHLTRAVARSRFACLPRTEGGLVRLDPIRLAAVKDYCGSHPGPCRAQARRHRHYAYLEGADWVEWNDLVNDVLDRLEVEADVSSSVCITRQGRERRIHYDQVFISPETVDWERRGSPGDYEDWCGQRGAPASTYPDGTPGLYKPRRTRLSEAARRRGEGLGLRP